MSDVREKILNSARELFIQQGYKKTTIRQISHHSGVLTGSIYYFFKNKEDIFQSLALDLLDRRWELVSDRYGENEGPIFAYAMMVAVGLRATEIDERFAEFHYEGYSSKFISSKGIEHLSKTLHKVFQPYDLDFTYDDYYIRALALNGIIRDFIKYETSLEEKIDILLDIGLALLKIELKEIEAVKVRMTNMNEEIDELARLLVEEVHKQPTQQVVDIILPTVEHAQIKNEG